MSNTPTYWNTAKKYLSKKDKVMSSLISKYKSPSEKILTTRKDIFFLHSNMWVYYSCLATDTRFFKVISLLNIINEEKITNKAPIKVFEVGISSQII